MPQLAPNNGKRIVSSRRPRVALRARDLPARLPLHRVDADPKARGMMRTQIPKFRLPGFA